MYLILAYYTADNAIGYKRAICSRRNMGQTYSVSVSVFDACYIPATGVTLIRMRKLKGLRRPAVFVPQVIWRLQLFARSSTIANTTAKGEYTVEALEIRQLCLNCLGINEAQP